MSAARKRAACGSVVELERAQGGTGGVLGAAAHTATNAAAEEVARVVAHAPAPLDRGALARLADFAARRAELATDEAEYLAELARTADPGLAAPADPSVYAPVTTGFHPAAPEPREYLTQVALADMLDTHPRTVRRMELAGELPDAIEIGRLKRWRRSTVQTWLDEGCPKPRKGRR